MKLTSVEVTNFGRIEHAKLEFGEGLNVLYGPNDFGKSTVVSAIRAALLLPHTSTHAKRFIPWDRDAKPQVRLTFSGDDGRQWRVAKTFSKASGGSSLLEASEDGHTFTVEAKGRQVDGELRKLLGWGIASPGGKSAPRGLPESFLTHVLLGNQDDASALLGKSVEEDSDEAGRGRLVEALQAFAQDPAFKVILDTAMLKVDEAFSPTGKPSKARGTPFVRVRDEVNEARRARDVAFEELQAARHVIDEGSTLQAELVRATAVHADVQRATADARRDHSRGAAHAQASQRLAETIAEFDELVATQAKHTELTDRIVKLRAAEDEVPAREAAVQDARQRLENAHAAAHAATEDDAERERTLRMKDLQRDGDQATHQLQLAQAAATARAIRDASREALSKAETSLREAVERDEHAAQLLETAKDSVERLELARDGLAAASLRQRVESMSGGLDEARELRKDAKSKRAAATRAENQVADAPSAHQLERIEKLASDLALAEARLDVGVSIAIRRQPSVEVVADVDGQAAEVQGEAIDLQGERRVRLQIGLSTGEPLVELVATGGSLEAHADAERLRAIWQQDAVPVLGELSLKGLRVAAEHAQTARRESTERREEATRLERRAVELEARASELTTSEQQLAVLETRLGGVSFDELEGVDPAQLHDRREAAREKLAEANAARDLARTNHQTHTSATAAAKREAELVEAIPSAISVEKATQALSRVEAAITLLSSQRESAATASEERLAEAKVALHDAEARLHEARAAREQTLGALREARGRQDALQDQLGAMDAERRAQAVADARRAVDTIAAPEQHVSDETLAAAEHALQRSIDELSAAHKGLDRQEGRLEQVGGAVAEERYAGSEEAFELAERRRQEIETDYNAWKLLVETLRDTENDEGHHLGQALSKPVSEELAKLLRQIGDADAQRYGGIVFGATLGADGLAALGELRPTEVLSVGTQEQIATLLRLTIAKHLGAPLVLDDHLTHTDPQRRAWFRDALRAAAHDTQVLVITCHPRSYLDADELAPPSTPYRERAAGLLRAIDATQVISS